MTVGLGFGFLDQVESIEKRGRKLRSFNKFIEACEYLQHGEIGDEKTVKLSLGSSKIEINGNFAKLKTDKGVKEAHRLPFSAFHREYENFSLGGGTIQIELSESEKERRSELFFDISRDSNES